MNRVRAPFTYLLLVAVILLAASASTYRARIDCFSGAANSSPSRTEDAPRVDQPDSSGQLLVGIRSDGVGLSWLDYWRVKKWLKTLDLRATLARSLAATEPSDSNLDSASNPSAPSSAPLVTQHVRLQI